MRSAMKLALLLPGACVLAFYGCGDSPLTGDPEALDAPTLAHEVPPPEFMTGGGRIDCSVGEPRPCEPVKSTPDSHDFQTWGFVFGDKNGDGLVEGNLQHVDHREAFRINGKPRNYHSVSWTFYESRDPDLWCPGGGDGAALAGGTIERKNDGTVWSFVVRAVDCGEPGTKAPHDIYFIDIADGYSVEGKLTGGNIQAHIRGN